MFYGTHAMRPGYCQYAFAPEGRALRPCTQRGTYHVGSMLMCWMHGKAFFEALEQQATEHKQLRFHLKTLLMRADPDAGARKEAARELASGLIDPADIASKVRITGPKQVVYFMERDGMVKIGISKDVSKRMKQVSKGSSMIPGMTLGPVTLLGTMPGGRDQEFKLHRQFRHLRVDGEWFHLTDEIKDYIAQRAS